MVVVVVVVVEGQLADQEVVSISEQQLLKDTEVGLQQQGDLGGDFFSVHQCFFWDESDMTGCLASNGG